MALNVADPARTARELAGDHPVLQLHELSKSYGGVLALDRVTLDVRQGEMMGVIGANGSGKTTLLNVLSGITRPTGGSFTFDGVPSAAFAGRPERAARLGLSRTFQGIRMVPGLDLLSNVVLGAYSRRTTTLMGQMLRTRAARLENQAAAALAAQLLNDVGVDHASCSSIGGLPYGTLRRIEIARALMPRPRLLLLDEPTAGMTARETAEVFELLHDRVTKGTSVMVVEHDVAAIARHCDRIAVLNFGKLLALGPAGDVLRSQDVVEAYVGSRARV